MKTHSSHALEVEAEYDNPLIPFLGYEGEN